MAKEADFYSPEEVARALGLPERRVFGMLCSGELEGEQDEWARWRVPAGALNARRGLERSSEPDGSAGDDAAATTVSSDRAPLWEPPRDADASGGEETTQEAVEALAGDPVSRIGDEEVTRKLPRNDHQEAAAPDETVRELTERLAAAKAEARELRIRLEHATAAEVTLRESLDRERRRADRFQEELRDERGKGFWHKLSGG